MEKIAVQVYSDSPAVYVIPEGAVELMEGPFDACVSNPTAEGCPEYFDIEKQQYFQIGGSYTAPKGDTGASFQPNLMLGETDNRGLLRFYIFADQVPAPGGTTSLTVDIGVAADVVEISTGTGS